jgi:protein TonB
MYKTIFLALFGLIIWRNAEAQTSDTTLNKKPVIEADNNFFTSVEVEPHFKTGLAGFIVYLQKTVKFSDVDIKNGTSGKVIVTFVVEKDGTLSNVKPLRGPSQTIMDAVVKAVQQSPPWIPGIQNGSPVRVQYTIAFAFNLMDK